MNKKNKHLTIEDREFIEELLTKDIKLKTIAEVIRKEPTTGPSQPILLYK